MKLGMVGLGRMGGNMAKRLRQKGHEVVGFAPSTAEADVDSLAEMVEALGPSLRVVWVMVPSGDPTQAVVDELAELLGSGDVVVDGGNSNFRDSQCRAVDLDPRGIGFLDAGVSGGIWGLEEGYCLMVGGAEEHVELVRPAFEALAPEDGFAHVGPSGAGHFVKMVHNGIEYGLMQAYAEGYELMRATDLEIDCDAAIQVWRHGSVVRSWLLDLLCIALGDDPGLEGFRGYASDSGEGRWMVNEAIRTAVPLPVITAALFARFASRQETSPAMKVISALRSQFGGHSEQAIERRPAESMVETDGKVRPG